MKNESKIVELLTEMLKKHEITIAGIKSMRNDIAEMKEDMKAMKKESKN
jgi:hypothetical protein